MSAKSTPRPSTPIVAPKTHHLDSRADQLLTLDPDDDGDDLLSTLDVARWLGVSPQWLTIGRHKNYGPKYIHVSTRRIAYRRDDVRAWLKSRTFSCTKQYTAKTGVVRP